MKFLEFFLFPVVFLLVILRCTLKVIAYQRSESIPLHRERLESLYKHSDATEGEAPWLGT